MNANSAETRLHETARFYQPSGRVGAGLYLWLPLLGITGAILLGTVGAFFQYLIGEVMGERGALFWVTPLFALALVLTANLICKLGKVRNDRLRKPIALLVGALGFYALWHIYILFANDLHIYSTEPAWFMSPLSLVRHILELAQYRGWSSWLLWATEATALYLFIVYFLGEFNSKLPFCEKCEAWAKEVFSLELSDKNIDSAVEQLKHGRVEGLGKLRPRSSTSETFALLRILRCPCSASSFLCLDSANIKPGTKGGWRYGSLGGTTRLRYRFGSGKSTELSPIITYLELDDQMQQNFTALQLGDIKPK